MFILVQTSFDDIIFGSTNLFATSLQSVAMGIEVWCGHQMCLLTKMKEEWISI